MKSNLFLVVLLSQSIRKTVRELRILVVLYGVYTMAYLRACRQQVIIEQKVFE